MSVATRSPEHLLKSLPPDEQRAVLSMGAAFRRIDWQERLYRATAHIRELEARYGCSLAELEARGLPADADVALHEDYVEWHYWERVQAEATKTLAALDEIARSG